MKLGTLYGIGVGPGDPELMTVKGASLLSAARWVFVPKATRDGDSLALTIARRYLRHDAQVAELVFPMTADRQLLARRWTDSAQTVAAILCKGDDACFLTLGDPSLYSTWTYLRRALAVVLPPALAVAVPGITAVTAAAALTGVALGEAKEPLTIVPTTDDMALLRRALVQGGTVAVMKVGRRRPDLVALLAEEGALGRACLVSRAGLEGQRIEKDLRLLGEDDQAGYLSIVLVPPQRES